MARCVARQGELMCVSRDVQQGAGSAEEIDVGLGALSFVCVAYARPIEERAFYKYQKDLTASIRSC